MNAVGGYNPWDDAAVRYPHIHIERLAIAPVEGALVLSENVILIDAGLDRAGRRCALTHEISHLDAGDVATDLDVVSRSQERRAVIRTATRLVTYDQLAAALLWCDSISELAEVLDVTPRVLRDAVDHMHPARREALARFLERRDKAA